jgi:hypothetical protein
MYNDSKDMFIRDLLIKIILVLLFIFLLIWLFPMPNLGTFYDKVFADNIKTMQDAAKDYYTVERLPENVGDKDVLTLKEMLEEKLIINFVDKDNKYCDEDKSYVEVTRTATEFIFKTYLVCPTQTDYIVTHVGCYDLCGDDCGETEETAIEYQFYRTYNKKVVDNYYCPTDYTLEGTKCIKTNSTTDTIDASKNCDTGYIYNSTSNKCEKTVTSTTDADPCSKLGSDYTFKNGVCVKSTTTSTNADPCSKLGADYTFKNGVCIKTISALTSADPCTKVGSNYVYNATSGLCEKAVTLTGSNIIYSTRLSCSIQSYTTPMATYSTYSSSITLKKIGFAEDCVTSCTVIYYTYEECKTIKYNYRCADSSYKIIGSTCTKQITDKKAPDYLCTSGIVSGTQCVIASTDTKPVSYSCATGTLKGTKCEITTNTSKAPVYTCTAGTVSGTQCVSASTDKKDVAYSCDAGYINAGSTCYKTSTVQDIKDANVTYKTLKNKEYKWSKESTLTGWTSTGKTRELTCTTTCK